MAKFQILLAEDHEAEYLWIVQAFSQTGYAYDLEWVCNGEEAIAYLQSNPTPHVILMDLRMPRMDGWEATEAIRQQWGELPYIAAFTGSDRAEDAERARVCGADEVLIKPGSTEDLVRLLQNALAHWTSPHRWRPGA